MINLKLKYQHKMIVCTLQMNNMNPAINNPISTKFEPFFYTYINWFKYYKSETKYISKIEENLEIMTNQPINNNNIQSKYEILIKSIKNSLTDITISKEPLDNLSIIVQTINTFNLNLTLILKSIKKNTKKRKENQLLDNYKQLERILIKEKNRLPNYRNIQILKFKYSNYYNY